MPPTFMSHPSIHATAQLHDRVPTASLRLYFNATLPEEARRLSSGYSVRLVVFALAGPGVPSRRVVGRTDPLDVSEALSLGVATWFDPVAIEYRFEVSQRFELAVIASDKAADVMTASTHTLSDEAVVSAAGASMPAMLPALSTGACLPDEMLAAGTFMLAHVVGSRGSRLTLDLKGDCRVTVHAEEVTRHQRDTVSFAFGCRDLKATGCCVMSPPTASLVLSRILPNGTRKELWASPPATAGCDPTWGATTQILLPDLTVGSGFDTRCVLLQVYHHGMFGRKCIGEARLSHGDLSRSGNRAGAIHFFLQKPRSTFPLSDAERGSLVAASPAAMAYAASTQGDRMSPRTATQLSIPLADQGLGSIFVASIGSAHVPTFNELLDSGMEVNLAVAIDFTASNGDPQDPQSLHKCLGGGAVSAENQYVRAIHSVCDILMEYDTDKMVPAFGFGAQLPLRPSQLAAASSGRARVPVTSHCFHLNGQLDPHVHSVSGILDSYARAVSSLRFSGPTYFAEIIRRATAAAVGSPGAYTVLLILTDGCINDTDATIDAIVEAGDAPLSIIIVGVGNADFSLMDRLDGDAVRLTNRFGVQSKRDLVQFVPFDAFASGPRWELAAEVLQEVPAQVEDWAKTHGITTDHFDAHSWAAADDEDSMTDRLREVRSPSPSPAGSLVAGATPTTVPGTVDDADEPAVASPVAMPR